MNKTLAILACWIIYPIKSYKAAIFNRRRNRAIKKADLMQARTCEKVMVMQDGFNFYVGVRSDFERMKRRFNKILHIHHKHRNVFDWRSAIIYSAK